MKKYRIIMNINHRFMFYHYFKTLERAREEARKLSNGNNLIGLWIVDRSGYTYPISQNERTNA